jgi:hypothetical protein
MFNDFRQRYLCDPTFDVLSHLDTMKQKKISTKLGFLMARCSVMKVIDFKITKVGN